jgi:5'-nucleotidase
VDLDPDARARARDLKHAGKKLVLITNSEWFYTRAMMSYAFDRFLPAGRTGGRSSTS